MTGLHHDGPSPWVTRDGFQRPPIATFFGGVVAASAEDEELAFEAGRELGKLGFTLHHGGYNGLMEHAARGAASVGAPVVAVTMSGKEEWGEFNSYVNDSIYARAMGTRLTHLVDRADVIIAMGGGVGSLHELTAALWYSGNIRRTPVILLGQTTHRLLAFLKHERWLYETPTRPLDFLHTPASAADVRHLLQQVVEFKNRLTVDRGRLLEQRVRGAACVQGRYELANGDVLSSFFDPFRLASDPSLSMDLADALAQQVRVLPDVVVGLALGGVALATDLSRALDRPLLIVRPQAKSYGTFAQVEGNPVKGQQALLVDDVVRSGSQMLAAVRLLQAVDVAVPDAMCLLERSEAGRVLLGRHDVALRSMWTDVTDVQGALTGTRTGSAE